MDFLQKLSSSIAKNNSLLCVGLDPDVEKITPPDGGSPFEFCKKIVDQTHDLVAVFKPNIAYFSAFGISGYEDLKKTIAYIHNEHGLPIILDAKRADMDNSSKQYAKEAFDTFNADAVTVNPYLGFDSIEPFLNYKEKGIIILAKTSNPGAKDFQDLIINSEPLYAHVAQKVVEWDKKYHNCLMVVGATYPNELKAIRKTAPDMFFLVPGIGSQGGDLEMTLKNGLRSDKSGLILSASRSVLYAKDPRDAAIKLKDQINKFIINV